MQTCPKHNLECSEMHNPNYKLISIISADSLVNLATWILQFGSADQVSFVKGQLANVS